MEIAMTYKEKKTQYNYPDDVGVFIKINKRISDDFNKFCKERKIIKSKLVEEFFKLILVRYRDGSLDASKAHLTIDILRGTVCKSK